MLRRARSACFREQSQACAPLDDAGPAGAQDATKVEVAAHHEALTNDGSCSADQWNAIQQANLGANWLLEILFRIADIRLYANETMSVTVQCDPAEQTECFDGAYAYRPQDTNVLHFCPLYFTFDHNQGDYNGSVSQVGGLLHELSHFDGTTDNYRLFYGYDPCVSLAESNSDTAMNNADSWRYYLMQVK